MTNKTLRNSMGLASLSALALVMVACGGSSSSSTPATPTNQAPSTPVIVGPTSAITYHPAFYALSAVDPEGDAITFTVTGTGFTGSGNSATLTATAAGPAIITVVAKDSKNASSAAANLTVQVAANRAPQFISQANGQLTGTSNTINWTNFQVTAQDPDTDDVAYSVTGTPTFVDNTGAAVTGAAVAINATSGVVSFTGTVPTGKTSVTATFTIQAVDKLPGGAPWLSPYTGATATQVVTLTYFNGNLPPVITTTSLPTLPVNHYIPIAQGASGFPVQASDPNGDAISWSMTTSPNGAGLVLDTTAGPEVKIISGTGFTPLTSTASAITVNLTATDARGLSTTKVFTINVVADSKPTLNSTPYTETVSGVKFFDKSQVKDQVTGRARFFPGAIDWINAFYGGTPYAAGEADHAADPLATDTAFSNVGDQAVKGWTARTIFRDAEGDAIDYQVDPRSVYVSAPPYLPVGQPFTLTTSVPAGPANVYPILGILFGYTPLASEFPTITAADGTMTWRPVAHTDVVWTTNVYDAAWYTDNHGLGVFAAPSTWSFTVMGYEKVWNPATSTYVLLNDPAQAGRIDYSIKVQPNNRPTIGALNTIPNATNPVLGSIPTLTQPTTTLPIGGGASSDPTAYGRPSIQEPESRRYDISGTSGVPVGGPFNYSEANTALPAVWRWLVARAGGRGSLPQDVQIYDPDMTITSGHADAIHAAMGTPTVPAVDTTGNVPTIAGTSVDFYNPWIHGMTTDRGAFQVNWGPNRTQYLIARITGTASYSFPVSVRDQYERINNSALNINPIFGTVRFANARIRQLKEGAENAWGNGADTTLRYTGMLRSSANEGDNTVNAAAGARYTFSYLPFPSTQAGSELNFGPGAPALATHIFDGVGPASGTDGSGIFTAASWITLYSVQGPAFGFHQGNPLNDEYGTFNRSSYAQGRISSGSTATSSWQNYSVDGAGSPVADPHRSETGLYADTEYRAQVIPSTSPYLFSIFGDRFRNNADDWMGPGNFAPLSAEMTQYNRTIGNFKIVDSQSPALNGGAPQYWQTRWWTPNLEPVSNYILASTWYYGKRQGEIDYSSAYAGRDVLISQADPDSLGTRMRWTYTWPTVISNANLGRTAGPANKYELGDVLQIAVPNMNSNARWFFTGDGNPQGIPVNDPLFAQVQTWGRTGISGFANFAINGFTPAAADSVNILGTAANNQATSSGFIAAETTPFHVVTDSAWSPNESLGTLNVPNRTTFSAGVNYTEQSFTGTRGYINNTIAGFVTDPGLQLGETFMANNAGGGDQFSTLGNIKLGQGDKVWFTWMKQDLTKKNAWGTWAASLMEPGSTYQVSGGNTKVPTFDMSVGVMNDTQAQIAFSQGTLPGVNNPTNFGVGTPYNSTFSIWQRSQWAGLANGVSRPSSARLVNPAFNHSIVGQTLDRTVAEFFDPTVPSNSRDGGIRDSAVIYGVRVRPGTEPGEAGIEPGSPVLAQWWNLQEGTDAALNGATVATGVAAMTDVGTSNFPTVFRGFYNPMVESANAANWITVMEFKVNFLAGVRYPSASAVATDTLYKVPATVSNVFQMGAALTDPTCTNPGNVVDMGRPVVSPVRFLAINDYVPNYTGSSRMNVKLDLVNSFPTDPVTGVGSWILAGSDYRIYNRSNATLTWQSSVNNQVLPSGYIVELYRLTGDANNTNQPILLGSFRMGHIGGKEAIQVFHMPAFYTWRQENSAVYFFRVRTMWMQGIDMEKAPNKSRFPMAYADFVSSPFVTR